MADEYLVFFETSGNQAYIYATNKLAESIGASELTYRAGTQWVLEAAGFNLIDKGQPVTTDPAGFRAWLGSGHSESADVEVVLATSGKAMLVVKGIERSRRLVSDVTTRATLEAPGMSITGAVVPLAGRETHHVCAAIQAAHQRFNENRDLMPSPQRRFGLVPFVQPCSTSGLPASRLDTSADGSVEPRSELASGRKDMARAWSDRINKVFSGRRKEADVSLRVTQNPSHLEKEFDQFSWAGVVFSDGNGLGQIIMRFDQWLEPGDDYLSTLRAFSLALDEATEKAFYRACLQLAALGAGKGTKHEADQRLPLVPLLLGGDDLTVMVDGHYALPFAEAFLSAFDEESGQQEVIRKIARKALGAGRLSACAGVAIVKKNFPFYSAQSLAEALLKSAKTVKKKVVSQTSGQPFPCSALDFHVLYDVAYSSLDRVRQDRRTGPDGEMLWGGPYVVTELEKLRGASEQSQSWAGDHQLASLQQRVKLLNARDEDGRLKLPSSQTHYLREALAQGRGIADRRLAELRRYEALGLSMLKESPDSLFREESDGTGEPRTTTRYLDALVSCAFWGDSSPSENVTEEAQ